MSDDVKRTDTVTMSNEVFLNAKSIIDLLEEKRELNCEKPPQKKTYDAGYYDALQMVKNEMVGAINEYTEPQQANE